VSIYWIVRFLHVADTHLGYSAYHKLAENGINQREMDTYNAFREVVDYAIATKPDAVIHAGDLFDTIRPSNRAIYFALQQLLRLSREGIPAVIISGNHETPKLRETGSVFRIFQHLDFIYPVYKAKLEVIDIGDARIYAIPHCHSTEELIENIKMASPEKGKINIMMLHVGVTGIKEFSYLRGDFNEQIIPAGYLSPEFDYIALGHYHRATEVTKNAFYSGSTEHFSFKEAGERKGFYDVEIDGEIRAKFVEVNAREMIDAGTIDCSERNADEIEREILQRLEGDIDGKMIRIKLAKIDRAKYKEMSWEKIKRAAARTLHFEVDYDLREMEQELMGRSRIGSLEEEWREYIKNIPLEKDREEVEKLALKYLSEVSS